MLAELSLSPTMFGDLHGAPHRFQLEDRLRVRRHVVEEERQRQFRREVLDVFEEFRLAVREIVGRREHERLRAGFGGEVREVHRFDEGGVRDADQHRHAPGDLAAGAFDHLAPQPIAEARRFAGGAEHEEAVHAAGEDVLDETLQAGDVEFVAGAERGDDGRDDAAPCQ